MYSIVGSALQNVSLSLSQAEKLLPQFLAEAQQCGWDLSRVLFVSDEWRCNWTAIGWRDDAFADS